MVNMRTVMLRSRRQTHQTRRRGTDLASVSLPKQLRETRIVKDKPADDIAREIVEWIKK